MFKDLDPLLHAQVRLAILTILISFEKADFSFLLEKIKTTKGNLSFQLTKLKEAGYIEVNKTLQGNYPLTTCVISEKGHKAYKKYVEAISAYFEHSKNNKSQ